MIAPSILHHSTNGNGELAAAHSAPSEQFRVVLYSHDTMGLGNLRRNQLISLALMRARPDTKILLITGWRQAVCFDFPDGVDCITLPSFCKKSDGRYASRYLDVPLDQLTAVRSALIRAAIESFDPHLFVADKVPRGACDELDSALAWIKAKGRARCALGLRDVLYEPAAVKRDWRNGRQLQAIRQYYDEIWIYGDRRVYDMGREYGWPAYVTDKMHYTGYLHQQERLNACDCQAEEFMAEWNLPAGRLMLCTVGGGQDGQPLAEAFLRAELPEDAYAVLLTGPFMPAEARRELHRLAASDLRRRVIEFVPEADLLVRRADRLVTMGGFNSVCAALSFGKPALVVPRVVPRREQLIRAQRLQALGLIDMLRPAAATPQAIADWMARPTNGKCAARNVINMEGLERLVALVRHPNGAEARRHE